MAPWLSVKVAGGLGIESKPSFRGPFKYRRCIIPASDFYEWRQMENGKQPYFIRLVDGGYFAFAPNSIPVFESNWVAK